MGLLNAVRNFDPGSGSSFETYARIRIRGEIFDELRRLDWVPRSIHAKARKVQEEAMLEVEQKSGCAATEEEMARTMQISVGEYKQLLNQIRPTAFVSLDAVQNCDGEEGPNYYENVQDPSQERKCEECGRRSRRAARGAAYARGSASTARARSTEPRQDGSETGTTGQSA